MSTLAPTVRENAPQDVFAWKIEEFLTCLNLSIYLRENYLGANKENLFVELSLNAIHKALHFGMSMADIMLLIGEMPKILALNYPVVKNIRDIVIQIIPQILVTLRTNNRWQEYSELDYKLDMLKIFKL